MEAIAESLSASRVASDDTHWTIWSASCGNVTINPLILLYEYIIPILATFASEYRHCNISASDKNVFSRTVEDAVCSRTVEYSVLSIGQVLIVMGDKYLQLNSEMCSFLKRLMLPHNTHMYYTGLFTGVHSYRFVGKKLLVLESGE